MERRSWRQWLADGGLEDGYLRFCVGLIVVLTAVVFACEGKLSPVVGQRPASFDDRWDDAQVLPGAPPSHKPQPAMDPRLAKVLAAEKAKTI